MCGIAGLWTPGLGDLSGIAGRMADALRHRGPDDGAAWSDQDAGVALGHRRLAIIDLSPAGRQPMASASGRYVIVYNGEIYNFEELRQELTALGVGFRGGSDTEVMLAAIEQWGLAAAIGRFIGMFAFALWDRERRQLSLARDRLGIKPLYWGRVGGALVFASEPRAMQAVPGWTGEIDRDSLTAFARWNYVPAPHCIFAGLHKLEPATILRFSAPASEPGRQTYWDIREIARNGLAQPLTLDDTEATDRLDALLGDAVGRRMVADVPLGAFLSGGIDSSLVAALMQSRSERPIRTFTIGFGEQQFNEAEHAKAVAAHLGTEHEELYLSSRDAMEVIPSLSQIYDEPFADSSQIPTYLVSRMTRRRVTVALSGDGGDELMAGYTRYRWAEMLAHRAASVPLALRRLAANGLGAVPDMAWRGLGGLLPERVSRGRLGDRVGRFSSFLEMPDGDAIYLRQHTQWPRPEQVVTGGHLPSAAIESASLRHEVPHFLSRMQLMDTMSYLPDDVLTKVDRASMAVSLEARVPLLDHRVVEFAWRLPFAQKHRDGKSKWLLRQVLHRYVPEQLIERPKMGFGVPIADWLRAPLRDWAEDLLSEAALKDTGLLNPLPIRQVWQRLLRGHDRFQEPIWGILMFQDWLRRQAPSATNHSAKTA